MLGNNSILSVADNSGVKKIMIIRCLGGSRRRFSFIGDLVVASVKKINKRRNNIGPHLDIKKGDIVISLIVSSRKNFFREKNNTWIKSSKNFALIIKEKAGKEFLAKKISIPLIRELEEKGYKKMLSLSSEIL